MLPQSPPTPRPPPPLAPPRRWVRRLLLVAVTLTLLGGLLWAGWYVYNYGFSRKWREQLTAELRRRGLGFTAARLTLNPFEGLVAEDAHLYLLDAHHTRLLYINRVTVDISLFNLIQKKSFLNSLDLRGAVLTLPVDMTDPDSPTLLKLRRFQAKLAILPGEIRLTQATGDFHGVELSASGRLLNPDSFSSGGQPASREEIQRRKDWVRAITEEVEKVRSSRAPPRLEIRFQGDVSQPSSLRVFAQLQGDALRRGNYELERLRVQLDYAAGAFHLQQAELADAHGMLAGQADFDPGTGDLHFQVQSGLDLIALAREFGGSITVPADLKLQDTPQVQLDGHAHVGLAPVVEGAPAAPRLDGASPLQLTGHLALGRFTYHTFPFERAESDFSWNGDHWYLRGLRIVRPGGGQQITGDVLSDPGQVNLRLTSTLDPMPFVGLLPKKGREATERLEFRDPPRLECSVTGRSFTDLAGLSAKGQLTLGRTRYRGVGLNRFHGDWTFGNGLLSGRALKLERDEGIGTADQVVYDLDKHEVRIDNARLNLDTGQVAVWLDPDVYHTIVPFRFRKPPSTIINGNVQFDGGRNSHLVTEVNAPGGMDYTFVRKNLGFQTMAGQVVFNEERLQLNDLHGEIFGGQARGSLDLALGHAAKDYAATISLKNVDFARLTKLYFDFDSSRGELSGDYHFTGRGDDPRTLHGEGTLNVDRGNVFAIPFLGPLSGIVGTVLPGLGFDVAHQATASFLTSDGKIYTGDLDVKGTGFALYGGGWLGYTNDTMNFRVRLNSRGLPGAVLFPVSKLFEYSSLGPLSKPIWRPRVLTIPVPGEEKKPAIAPPGQTPAVAEKVSPPAPPKTR